MLYFFTIVIFLGVCALVGVALGAYEMWSKK